LSADKNHDSFPPGLPPDQEPPEVQVVDYCRCEPYPEGSGPTVCQWCGRPFCPSTTRMPVPAPTRPAGASEQAVVTLHDPSWPTIPIKIDIVEPQGACQQYIYPPKRGADWRAAA
jgi:hypothetical protein